MSFHILSNTATATISEQLDIIIKIPSLSINNNMHFMKNCVAASKKKDGMAPLGRIRQAELGSRQATEMGTAPLPASPPQAKRAEQSP